MNFSAGSLLLISIALLIFSNTLQGHDRDGHRSKPAINTCGCAKNFEFVKSYMEKNHAAFHDNVPPDRRSYYELSCKKIRNSIENDCCRTRCNTFISRYLHFFKDRHIYIRESVPFIDEQNDAEIDSVKNSRAFKETEKIDLNMADLTELYKKRKKNIEGIYYSFPSHDYKIALQKRGNSYKGVVLKSDSKLWLKGQVKFVLKPLGGKFYSARIFLRDHSQEIKNIEYENGALDGLFMSKNGKAPEIPAPFEFKKLNDSTNYIKIGSFWANLYGFLDSCYQAHFQALTSLPYLVIDVRDNGGGSEKCYEKLIDLLYTNPISDDRTELYVTPDNIKLYQAELEKMKADTVSFGKSAIAAAEKDLQKMKRVKSFTFLPMESAEPYIKRARVYPFPGKIALVYNHNCASSCEAFIAACMQSRKVVSFGERSGGYTGYGNVLSVQVPDSKLTLGYTTTRYKQMSKYEGLGIPPSHRLNFNADWLTKTLAVLYRRPKKSP